MPLLLSRPTWAWDFGEHKEAGRTAFVAACDRLLTEVSASTDSEAAQRFRVACGAPVPEPPAQGEQSQSPGPDVERYRERASVYGQAVAISGDLLATPEQFFSAIGGEKVLSTRYYIALAVVNSSHFLPESIRRWRKLHADAVADMLAASALPAGAARDAAFEHASYLNAFADHFLQDAFATGHMGFNRPASSTAASFVFHQRWGREGRILRNRRGNIWIGYGDGRLFDEANATTRRLMDAASVSSIHAVLHAFAFGRRCGGDDEEVEAVFPAMTYLAHSSGYMLLPWLKYHFAPDELRLSQLRTRIEQASSDEQRRAIGRATDLTTTGRTADDLYLSYNSEVQNRAYKDYGIDVRWIYGGASFGELGNVQALLVELNLRAISDSMRFLVSGGFSYRPKYAPILGPGFAWHFASSLHGLITHDALLSAWVFPNCWSCGNGTNVLTNIGYRLNIESSRFVFGLLLAPSVVRHERRWDIGWLTGLSFEVLLTSSGGGPLRGD